MADRHILVVPGGDGFGPSSLVSHVVRDLVGHGCRVTIWNDRRAGDGLYNRALFADEPRVEVVPVADRIVLGKVDGGPSIPATLANLGDYRAWSEAYPGFAMAPEFDLVLDFGVPAAARWAGRQGLPSISFFDHGWSRTLSLMAEMLPATPGERDRWQSVVAEIEADERAVREMILFPPYITPEVFRRHWRDVLATEPGELPGVLGGHPAWDRDRARRFLGLTEPGPVVLVQAGDTPAWDPVIPALVAGLGASRLEANVVLHVPERLITAPLTAALEAAGPRLRRLRIPPGTMQLLLPAVDVIVSRAGGGTVNDALACHVPLVCVEEPGQEQVALILRGLEERRLARRVAWDAFVADPARVCRAQWEQAGNWRPAEIPRGAEAAVTRRILEAVNTQNSPDCPLP
jgi:hypothetical protein